LRLLVAIPHHPHARPNERSPCRRGPRDLPARTVRTECLWVRTAPALAAQPCQCHSPAKCLTAHRTPPAPPLLAVSRVRCRVRRNIWHDLPQTDPPHHERVPQPEFSSAILFWFDAKQLQRKRKTDLVL